MRIISGTYKGRRITAPKKLPVRPTTDMAKEALFNIINNLYYFDEISVLDLFSGTGNISYEFASRGTKQITSVDADYGCIRFINETAEGFKMPIQTIKSNVFTFLEKTTTPSTIIFADPPYDFPLEDFSKIPELVFQNNLLEEEGVLIIEHSKHTKLSHLPNFSYSKSYGGNMFSFFELAEEE
ncbi:RsmD family RNA methyltransferase [Oceanihabitans sediminis]|uniref:16S rRNA (Guanine(966)-N(2))-methyltransferase RsmD n=1 Tax=Oceanihabitans sediminis TaxID=1812012 RepID=A0A368P496_9FLAO|nr:RsmD family RNA methyltransferase [Oceanihabitans sediminis]MDX1278228.1 RsmD family RNA methyltransferase [Oceanihabitans sediminis]MDX1773733.1 RsmD family RNA methyltransferase [Oceanihabitans sediminis]RBP33178.1 16S rRNA (guanine(966)-N(2))-methyltransferase RsmD [Oceanihabitans sediminis]RCU57318.1 16S rRNA (guanine(966)-N(2))-methyltransferase RsmD [Oceanihabitans sediminis]